MGLGAPDWPTQIHLTTSGSYNQVGLVHRIQETQQGWGESSLEPQEPDGAAAQVILPGNYCSFQCWEK